MTAYAHLALSGLECERLLDLLSTHEGGALSCACLQLLFSP